MQFNTFHNFLQSIILFILFSISTGMRRRPSRFSTLSIERRTYGLDHEERQRRYAKPPDMLHHGIVRSSSMKDYSDIRDNSDKPCSPLRELLTSQHAFPLVAREETETEAC